jgi:hypothetical protein
MPRRVEVLDVFGLSRVVLALRGSDHSVARTMQDIAVQQNIAERCTRNFQKAYTFLTYFT